MKTSNTNKEHRFAINFFEYSFLLEACIPPRPIGRMGVWFDAIDVHYDNFSQQERDCLFKWINRCYGMEYSLEKGDENCLLFNARYDYKNQYIAHCLLGKKMMEVKCFLFQGKYHTARNTFVYEGYIQSILRVHDNQIIIP